MARMKLRKPTALTSIAALLACAAMPSVAMADERPSGWQGHGRSAPSAQSQPRAERPQPQAQRVQSRPSAPPQQRAWSGQRGSSSGWQARRPSREAQAERPPMPRPGTPPANRVTGQRPPTARPSVPTNGVEQRRWQAQQQRDRAEAVRRDNNRDRDRSNVTRPGYNYDRDRPNVARPGYTYDRDHDRRPGNGWNGNRPDQPKHYAPRPNDDRRWSYSNGNYNWNRNWRNDNRYDWRNYRTQYRYIYSPGYYRAPYASYYYRPMLVGSYLSTGFYGSSYWLDDPWEYRLPQAYGPYRWVRYFDDVLLVNIHTGIVVDVIRNFFW